MSDLSSYSGQQGRRLGANGETRSERDGARDDGLPHGTSGQNGNSFSQSHRVKASPHQPHTVEGEGILSEIQLLHPDPALTSSWKALQGGGGQCLANLH